MNLDYYVFVIQHWLQSNLVTKINYQSSEQNKQITTFSYVITITLVLSLRMISPPQLILQR